MGRRPVHKLFMKGQRELFDERVPNGFGLNDLAILGPINVLKLKFTPEGYPRKMVVEVWFYPDGSRIIELSTKCEPSEAFQVGTEARHFS